MSGGKDDVAPDAAMPDPEFLEDVIGVDDLAGADLDERQTLRKVRADLEALLESVRQGAMNDQVWHAASNLLKGAFADKVVQRASQMQFFVRDPFDSAIKTTMKAALSCPPLPKAAMLGAHASPLKLQTPKSLLFLGRCLQRMLHCLQLLRRKLPC